MKFAKIRNCFVPMFIFGIAICLIVIFTPARSQFDQGNRIAIGLSTVKLIGDNPGGFRIFRFPDSDKPFGGSFDQSQLGIELRLTMPIDDDQTFRIPFGIDYQFYSAKEIAANYSFYDKLHHSLNMLSFYFGIHWTFVRFPLADAIGYIGLEARSSYLNSVSVDWETVFRDGRPSEKRDFPPKLSGKVDAWRFGGSLRIGIEGDLDDRIQINPSVAFSILNLLNRDNSRGELLTYSNNNETVESLVYNYHISILFQYKL